MKKRYPVEVRQGDGTVVETIHSVLRAEQIGNFNPLFCRYKGKKRCLVESDDGDVSDPFRRSESYKLFIQPRGVRGDVVPTWADAFKSYGANT